MPTFWTLRRTFPITGVLHVFSPILTLSFLLLDFIQSFWIMFSVAISDCFIVFLTFNDWICFCSWWCGLADFWIDGFIRWIYGFVWSIFWISELIIGLILCRFAQSWMWFDYYSYVNFDFAIGWLVDFKLCFLLWQTRIAILFSCEDFIFGGFPYHVNSNKVGNDI